MTTPRSESSRGVLGRIAVWIATGFGLGLVCPAPGTFGTAIWGLPLAWAIGQLPGIGWQIAAIVIAILIGIPIATAAGQELGGKKDNQAIIWDEIATTPIVFLLLPLSNWKVAIAGLLAHRLFDITKPRRPGSWRLCPRGWASWPTI